MISIRKKSIRTATRSRGSDKERVWRAETTRVGIEVNDEKQTVLSSETERERTKEKRTENSKEVKTESSEDVEREVSDADNIGATLTSSEAAETETGPEVEVLQSAMK